MTDAKTKQQLILMFLRQYDCQIEHIQDRMEELVAENAQIPKEEQDPELTKIIHSFYRLS